MSTITIPIEDEDLQYLTQWTATFGVTVEEFFANEARTLRRNLAVPLHSALIQASGIIAPDIDSKEAYLNYMDSKHA